MVRRPTAPSDGSASPRKPKLWMLSRSLPSILLVACRDNASGRSAGSMPQPSSVTRIKVFPPSAIATSIRPAPASIAFSTSSLTALAGLFHDLAGSNPVDRGFVELTNDRLRLYLGVGHNHTTRYSMSCPDSARGLLSAFKPFRFANHNEMQGIGIKEF